MRRYNRYPWAARVVMVAVLAMPAAGCGKAAENDTIDASPPGMCAAGTTHCAGNVLQTCVDGSYQDSQTCASACSDALGCVQCVPGSASCTSSTISHVCNMAGTGYEDVTCDPVQGVSCGSSGLCEGACAPQSVGQSYIGCEYYPTVIGNMVSAEYKFAVAVANTTSIAATVTIEDGPLASPRVFMVPPNGVHLERLPWQADLKLCMETSWEACSTGTHNTWGALVDKAAYHLRSTAPVTVYQFNPLDYTFTGASEASVTNDASLLLPATAWRTEYYVAAWQHNFTAPSELAVIASQHHTSVTITTRADTPASGKAPAFTTGVPQTVVLDEGSVLELTSQTGDLTGTHVVADKPVQVIGGHYAACVPQQYQYADHLEESMFPVATLGTRYMIVPPLTASLDKMAHYVRVIATHDDTTLTYEPAQTGYPTTIAKAGDFVELPDVTNSFLITGSQKILVAQYMEGAATRADGSGDPAMSLVVPIDEFRTSYLVHAPVNYIKGNFVDVVAPIDETVMFDGKPLDTEPIPSTDYALGRASMIDAGPGNDGNHTLSSAKPFGISVYGYAPYTSYWYPGGLDLIDVK